MGAVERLYETLANVEGRAAQGRRELWGGAIANIGQLPHQQALLGLEQAREKRLTAEAGQQEQLTKLKLDEAQRQQQGRSALAQAISANTSTDPDTGHLLVDQDKVYQAVASQYPDVAQTFLKQWSDHNDLIAKTQEDNLKAQQGTLKLQAQLVKPVLDLPEEQRGAAYATMLGTSDALFKNHPELSGTFRKLPPVYSPDVAPALSQLYESSRTQADRVEEALKTSSTRKNLAEAKKAEAEAESGPKKDEWNAFQDTFAHKLGATNWNALNPMQQDVGYKAWGTLKADPAAERQARAIDAATAQQRRQQDFTEAQAGRKELTDKVETPYQTATASSNTLRDVVAAAQAGNKVAGSLQSLETTMAAIRAQGLHRINTAEIGVTANAGSLWDRLQGWLGKAAEGQPVPADVQKDMLQFADILDKAAYHKYITGHQAVTKRYGLTDEKPLPAPNTAAPANTPDLSGLTPGHSRTFNTGPFAGQTWTLGVGGTPVKIK